MLGFTSENNLCLFSSSRMIRSISNLSALSEPLNALELRTLSEFDPMNRLQLSLNLIEDSSWPMCSKEMTLSASVD